MIEEKHPIIEDQISTILYNQPAHLRPRLTGKLDQDARPLLREVGELDPDLLLHVIANRLRGRIEDDALRARFDTIKPLQTGIPTISYGVKDLLRPPSFCAGCPHNTSTVVPDGSLAGAGIGCHIMAAAMPERNTMPPPTWAAKARSGSARRRSRTRRTSSRTWATARISTPAYLPCAPPSPPKHASPTRSCSTGAVAMTGGQTVEGEQFAGDITAPHVAHQLAAEGCKRVALVTDDLERHTRTDYPGLVTFHRARIWTPSSVNFANSMASAPSFTNRPAPRKAAACASAAP